MLFYVRKQIEKYITTVYLKYNFKHNKAFKKSLFKANRLCLESFFKCNNNLSFCTKLMNYSKYVTQAPKRITTSNGH